MWLNLPPDHLDWHRSMAGYEAAKARMWAHQRPADAAIGNADDPVVMARLAVRPGPPRHVRDGWRLPRRRRPSCARPQGR